MEIDQFAHNNDDFLIHVAVGNTGPAVGTVVAPATAKNILAVGASENSRAALLEYGDLPPALSVSGGPADKITEAYALEPAAFGAPVVVGGVKWSGPIVLAEPPDACGTTLTNAAQAIGAVVVIQRGQCSFGAKVLCVQQAGAIAAVVVNDESGSPVQMTLASGEGSILIPAVMISLSDGTNLRYYLGLGAAVYGSLPEDATKAVPGDGLETANRLATFSAQGPTLDRRFKPDIVCAGQNIRSVNAGVEYNIECGAACVIEKSGTSMAAPNCAGASALVRQYLREGYYEGGFRNASAGFLPTAALVKALVIQSGRPVFTLPADASAGANMTVPVSLPDFTQGFGRAELSSVLRFRGDGRGNLSVWNRETVASGASLQYCLSLPWGSSAPLRITIVWNDPPATPGAAKTLINNLDLVLIGPGGAYYYGNALSQWDEAHGPYPTLDTFNNVEQVRPSTLKAIDSLCGYLAVDETDFKYSSHEPREADNRFR